MLLERAARRQDSLRDKFELDEEDMSFEMIPGRLGFWDSTNRALRVRSTQARCHSFSQDFIAAMLHNIISLAIAFPNDKMPVQLMLSHLGMMVYGNILTEGWDDYDNKINLLHALDIPNHLNETVYLANDLMHKLNNSLYNLRVGDRSWNSSIGSDFDPTAWAYVADVNGSKRFISQEKLEWQQDLSGRPAGIHLTDAQDVHRLVFFRELWSILQNGYQFGIDVYEGKLDEIPCCIVGSSSNKFAKPGGCMPQKCSAIYIYNNGNWESIL